MQAADQRIDEKRYQAIPRTLIFLFDDQDRVLLLKGSRSKRLWAGLFNGIGGHIEVREDILQAAYRELRKETGISGVDLHFCGQIMVDVTQGTGIAIFIFKGDYTPLKALNFISEEGELKWIHLDCLDETPLVEDLQRILPRVARFQVGDPMMIARSYYSKEGKQIILFQ